MKSKGTENASDRSWTVWISICSSQIWGHTLRLFVLAFLPYAAAQAPNTDFAAWPSGLLTLVTSLYVGSTLPTSSFETNDPVACIRPLGVLDWCTTYRRSHDHMGTVNEVWLEPKRTVRAGSDPWAGRTPWQSKVQFSAHIARIRGDSAQAVVSCLRTWAMDSDSSKARIERSAREWGRYEKATPSTNPSGLSPAAISAGKQLTSAFDLRLESYVISAEEFSLLTQCLVEFAECAQWLALAGHGGHGANERLRNVLADAGLSSVLDDLGPAAPWFNDSSNHDTIHALYIGLHIRSRYWAHQSVAWSTSGASPLAHSGDLEKGFQKVPPLRVLADQILELAARSHMLIFTWRPLNHAGHNRSISLLSFIWGVRHFSSANLRHANPGELAVLSMLSGIGTTYKSVGMHFPSPIRPTSPQELADQVTSLVEEEIQTPCGWVGVLPITQVLYHGRMAILAIVVAFFVSLGSGASAWMCIALCLGVLPRDDPLESPEIGPHLAQFPWPPHTVAGLSQPCRGLWLAGLEYYKPYHGKFASPPFATIILGFAAAILAHVKQEEWRPALNFTPSVPPSKWIQWTSITLSSILAIIQTIWYVFRVNGHGPASRREGLLATLLGLIFGVGTIVICVLRLTGMMGSYARWIAEGTLCLTTLPLFIVYPDGPSGEREGGCRILYMWQWLLAGTVSLAA
ncbi:hypothetical protein HGRIS_006421 [Hohenbuehelia grisea]|uniref:Uncharacterized protein n=1 Tax=Hohenbuehelia grisea TaxID=104357 RepID=A0ABR3K0S5_9AGAR